MGLPEGDVYEAALVSEYAGRYQEYPLGSFAVNVRGQAGLMFRGSFPADNTGGLGVGGFKAFIARGGGKRVVGYRWEPVDLPQMSCVRMGSGAQKVLWRSGDDVRID